MVCEQYKNLHKGIWEMDPRVKTAVWACANRGLQQAMEPREHDFGRVNIDDHYSYSYQRTKYDNVRVLQYARQTRERLLPAI